MKIIAHRGACKLAPQNTIAAFEKALEFNVDGFENDVHLTKDGEIVICHNYEIDRTSNGNGKISDMTLDEIRSYDFGSYFSPEFAGEKIPTLDEFLEVSRNLEIVNIEVKTPEVPNDLVKKTLDRVKAFNMESQVVMSGFSKELMMQSKEICPEVRTAFLYDMSSADLEAVSEEPVEFCKKYNFDILHPMLFFITPELITKCHSAGIKVNAWTVNVKEGMEQLEALGVDGIITDVPEICV